MAPQTIPNKAVKEATSRGSTNGTKPMISHNATLDPTDSAALFLKHKRRFCSIEGCNRIVKSQGLCQRHGAKPRTCKVEGCTKQAQGNFDKMCKSHFKAMKRQTTPIPKVENKDVPPPAEGVSVYDAILPQSIAFNATKAATGLVMPLISHLKHGFDTLKPPAWHRNEERRARGLFPIDNPAAQLEGWERELVWMEILVLTGVPGASFRQLARAWGRDKGFHMVLAQFICERHGDVERKKRHGENGNVSGIQRPAVKKRKTNRGSKLMPDNVGADVWDPSMYGDVDTNEALAAEIFDFSEKEFERVTSKYRRNGNAGTYAESPTPSVAAQAAMMAILGDDDVRSLPMQPTLPGSPNLERNSLPNLPTNISKHIRQDFHPDNIEPKEDNMHHQVQQTVQYQDEQVTVQNRPHATVTVTAPITALTDVARVPSPPISHTSPPIASHGEAYINTQPLFPILPPATTIPADNVPMQVLHQQQSAIPVSIAANRSEGELSQIRHDSLDQMLDYSQQVHHQQHQTQQQLHHHYHQEHEEQASFQVYRRSDASQQPPSLPQVDYQNYDQSYQQEQIPHSDYRHPVVTQHRAEPLQGAYRQHNRPQQQSRHQLQQQQPLEQHYVADQVHHTTRNTDCLHLDESHEQGPIPNVTFQPQQLEETNRFQQLVADGSYQDHQEPQQKTSMEHGDYRHNQLPPSHDHDPNMMQDSNGGDEYDALNEHTFAEAGL